MKTVLITGGAKRLGAELVRHYANAGWRVMFTCQWSWEEGAKLANELGSNVFCLRTSVSNQSNASIVAQWCAGQTDTIDLLVCNASTFCRASIEETRPDTFDNLLESNLLGPFFLVQQCLPYLKRAQGCVINIADSQATRGVPLFSAYIAAKAGLISLTKSLAIELAPSFIRVNAVLPGSFEWPTSETVYSLEDKSQIIENIPLGCSGRWKDLVQAVAYLESAPYVTGTCLSVDGGNAATR